MTAARALGVLLFTLVVLTVRAEEATWQTDPVVGSSLVDLTIDITCTGSVICGVFDEYTSSRQATLTGAGIARLFEGGSFELVPDTPLTLPPPILPPLTAWVVETTGPFSFDPIPGVGTPTVTSGEFFGTGGPPFAVASLIFGPFGPLPIAETIDVGMRFDLTGLILPFPDQVVEPGPAPATAELEMLDESRFVIRDLTFDLSGSDTMDLEPGELIVMTTGMIQLNLSGELGVRLTVDHDELSWSPIGAATSYDVVRGDLDLLAGSGGDFTVATEECLVNGNTTTILPYSIDPDPGFNWWILVRAARALTVLSYDSFGPGQSGTRDAEIASSGFACP